MISLPFLLLLWDEVKMTTCQSPPPHQNKLSSLVGKVKFTVRLVNFPVLHAQLSLCSVYLHCRRDQSGHCRYHKDKAQTHLLADSQPSPATGCCGNGTSLTEFSCPTLRHIPWRRQTKNMKVHF